MPATLLPAPDAESARASTNVEYSVTVTDTNHAPTTDDTVILGAGAGAVVGHVKVFNGLDVPSALVADGETQAAHVDYFLKLQGIDGEATDNKSTNANHLVRFASNDPATLAHDVVIDGSLALLSVRGPISAAVGNGHVKVFDGQSGAEIRSFLAFPGFPGGVNVGAGDVNSDGFDDVIVGAGANGHVKVFDGQSGAEIRSFLAFPGFPGGVNVGAGDVNSDGFDDVIVGTGANGHVKVFDGQSGAEIRSFLAFPGFPGGVNVGAGDVNSDGFADVIVGAGVNGHVKVFDGQSGAEIRSFLAFPGFPGGVNVGAGDVNSDGFADVIVGAGVNGHVKVFDGQSGAEIRSFFAFPGFPGGMNVGAGDISGDGFADIITGTAPGAAHVKAFSGNGGELLSFLAFDSFAGGVNVAGDDDNGDHFQDIVTASGAGAPPHVKVFDGRSGAELLSFYAYGDFGGGVYIACGDLNSDGRADPMVISTITGRITAIAIDPSDASGNTIYIGAANGGVWK